MMNKDFFRSLLSTHFDDLHIEIMIYLNFFKAKALDLCLHPELILENICEGLQTYLFA
jgi:hypothetical protein